LDAETLMIGKSFAAFKIAALSANIQRQGSSQINDILVIGDDGSWIIMNSCAFNPVSLIDILFLVMICSCCSRFVYLSLPALFLLSPLTLPPPSLPMVTGLPRRGEARIRAPRLANGSAPRASPT
jgi:hypothetical protein